MGRWGAGLCWLGSSLLCLRGLLCAGRGWWLRCATGCNGTSWSGSPGCVRGHCSAVALRGVRRLRRQGLGIISGAGQPAVGVSTAAARLCWYSRCVSCCLGLRCWAGSSLAAVQRAVGTGVVVDARAAAAAVLLFDGPSRGLVRRICTAYCWGRDLVLSGISSVGAQRAVSVELRCEETLNCYIFIPVTGRRGFSAVGILL